MSFQLIDLGRFTSTTSCDRCSCVDSRKLNQFFRQLRNDHVMGFPFQFHQAHNYTVSSILDMFLHVIIVFDPQQRIFTYSLKAITFD